MSEIRKVGRERLYLLEEDGPVVASPEDVLDLVAQLWGLADQVDRLALPVSRLDPAFFDLRTGLAGAVLQKLVQYQVPIVVLGDLAEHEARSASFAAFVTESNAGRHVWFARDLDALAERLGAR